MDDAVQEGKDGRVSSWRELDEEPDGYWHTEMVEHMESAHLVVLFSQRKTDRVEELNEPGQDEDVAELDDVHRLFVGGRVVDGPTAPDVNAIVEQATGLNDPIDVDQHHEQIVHPDWVLQVERFSVGHQTGSEHFDDVEVGQAHGNDWPGSAAKQWVRFNPGIPVLVPKTLVDIFERVGQTVLKAYGHWH